MIGADTQTTPQLLELESVKLKIKHKRNYTIQKLNTFIYKNAKPNRN